MNGSREAKQLESGDIVIAAITSCTNTSNPNVMIAAGLVAKKAVEFGLTIKPWVKTSLAPGSKVVSDYLEKANLSKYLDDGKIDSAIDDMCNNREEKVSYLIQKVKK